jgi:hypothetical protein
MVPGPVVFARYAYPPNALGYCGPADPAGLLGEAVDGGDVHGLAQRAAGFSGAWPYLQVIAAANGIADPLDARVVDAYWVGNRLLDAVAAPTLAAMVGERFDVRRRGDTGPGATAAAGGTAHHSFHVFAVYPWLDLLRAGIEGPPLAVLDRCRIRSGTVEAVTGDVARVRSAPLCFRGSSLVLGAEEVEEVRRSADGVGFVHDLSPGDSVSMHWDWVCERLSPARRLRLEANTARTLALVNAQPSRAPAVAAEAHGG